MSSFAELRQGLSDSGYSIETESLVRDGHMIYQVLVCVYTGEKSEFSPAELLLGPENIKEKNIFCNIPQLLKDKKMNV